VTLRRWKLARPLVAVGTALLGLAVGVGAVLAVQHLGRRDPAAAPSVQHLDLPGGPATATTAAPLAPVKARSPTAAVGTFLYAAERGDFATTFGLLDRAGRRRYRSVAAWTAAQADRWQPTGFRIRSEQPTGDGVVDVRVAVTHRPAVDPFQGLTPGRTEEVWRARWEGGGWRVAADPLASRAVLPSDRGAPQIVQAWVRRLVACDEAGAARLQAVQDLYGPIDLLQAPCAQRGRWTAAGRLGFDLAEDPQLYLAAFGPEVQRWARLVPVRGPRSRFSAVVAPLGDAWRVIGIDARSAAG
jgi:hypothetical protein